MAKAHKYNGILGKPRESVFPAIDDPSYNPFDKRGQEAILVRLMAQQDALVDALFADCGIDRSNRSGWEQVALVLAERHIKAFQKPTTAGAKKGAKSKDESLMLEMQALINDGKSISNAARIIVKRRGVPKEKAEKEKAAIETHYHRTLAGYRKAHALLKRWAQQKSERNSVVKSRS